MHILCWLGNPPPTLKVRGGRRARKCVCVGGGAVGGGEGGVVYCGKQEKHTLRAANVRRIHQRHNERGRIIHLKQRRVYV